MWQSRGNIRMSYDTELLKQTDAYAYYIDNVEKTIELSNIANEGEHESVPLIYLNGEDIKLSFEDEAYRVYEDDEYFLYESKLGKSSREEKIELLTYARKLNADLIYGDVDGITCDGKRVTPFFKTEYSRDTFESFLYHLDFYAVRKNKSKTDIKCLDKIAHVPKVLFHFNVASLNKKDIDRSLSERNELYKNNNSYLTDEFYLENTSLEGNKDKISVIIPSKDNPSLVKTVLEGIEKAKIKSKINTLEAIVVDNGSTKTNQEEITGVIKDVISRNDGIMIDYIVENMEFNFSEMCNKGANRAKGEYLLFLNDDIEITDELFLLKLLYFAQMDHVGAVGCKLLYPGNEHRIQHIGITCLKYPGPSHKLSTFSDDDTLYFGKNRGIHNVLAVTGACLLVSKRKFFKIHGFYDKMKVGYNDVDLCVSLYENGYLNLVNNECVLVHHESISRGSDASNEKKLRRLDDERSLFYERHPWILTDGDPYYNSNLAEDFLDYRVNVIPDFEKRDFVSNEHMEFVRFVERKEKSLDEKRPSSKNLFHNVESIVKIRDYLEIKGWALINKKENYLFDTYIALLGADGSWHVYDTAMVHREDLGHVFPEARTTELSGFFARIRLGDLQEEGNSEKDVRLGILMINKQTGKKYYAGFTKSDI